MEIINGYNESLSLGTTVYNNITPETSNYTIPSNTFYFFTGQYDTEVLYNILNESSLLSTYASQYLGKISGVSLNFLYDDTKKQRIIKQTSPNALRFKDPRYVNTTYTLGTAFTKPTIGTKYKFKFTNSTVDGGFLLNGVSIGTTHNENIGGSTSTVLLTDKDGFDELFLNGTQVDGGAINFSTNQIFGYRVSGVGPKGYTSLSFAELKSRGYSIIECNVTLNKCGLTFVGSSWDNRLTSSYGSSPTKITINFNNMTVTNTFPYEGANTSLVDISGMDLSNLYVGMCGIQSYDGWVNWSVSLYKNLGSYTIESDFFTTTGNITITNTLSLTHTGFEVIPYGDDDKPLSNQINWCAIKIKNDANGDYFIFTDDIGIVSNPSFINFNTFDCVYGKDNIMSSVKIQYRSKSIGETL